LLTTTTKRPAGACASELRRLVRRVCVGAAAATTATTATATAKAAAAARDSVTPRPR